MLTITQNLVSESLWPLKCPYTMKPEAICIHNTANDASADNEIAYMHRNSDATSYHFAVDDEKAVQGLLMNRNGFHAGDGALGYGNRKTVAIEICYSKSGGTRFEKAQENAAELTAMLLHEFGWGCDLSRIRKHEDFADKHCPHRTLDDYGWDFYLNLVEEKYEILYSEEIPMTKEEKTAFEALEAKVKNLTERLDKYDEMGIYDNVANKWAYNDGNIPDWAKATITKLVKKGILKGNTENSLELSRLMMRILVILDRAGLFGD